jgi:hypothetical protein
VIANAGGFGNHGSIVISSCSNNQHFKNIGLILDPTGEMPGWHACVEQIS